MSLRKMVTFSNHVHGSELCMRKLCLQYGQANFNMVDKTAGELESALHFHYKANNYNILIYAHFEMFSITY